MADQPISAQTMARAARYDPQFAVPLRPRVRRGLSVRLHADRLVVDGVPTRHVLRGKAATHLVPRLLPLLDGVRDHDALAADLGVPTSTVFTALSLLWTCGVVEESAPEATDVGWVPDHLADYLSRIGDSTEANAAWESAAQRLATARVRVTGDTAFAEALRTELAGTLPIVESSTAERPTLVVALTTPAVPLDTELAATCWHDGIPLLRVDLTGDLVEIGPYVQARLGPCVDCLIADAPTRSDNPIRTESSTGSGDSTADDLVLAAALAAGDLVALIGRAARVGLPVRWRRVGLSRLGQSQRSGATRPGCPTCGTVPATEPRSAPLSARYEAAVALPPREYADVKAHQVHYQPANVALQRGHKSWPIAPRVPLPPADFGLLSAPTSDRLDADRLALLLAVVAGRQHETPERVWRWTASGGNIGSVVAHILIRDVDGIDPGVYGYVPSAHELSRLRDDPPPPCPDGCTDDACLLLTADFSRVATKYSAFGLRVVLLDAGCAHAAALTTVEALGLDARSDLGLARPLAVGCADEELGDLLGIDLNGEPITGLIHIGRSSGSVTDEVHTFRSREEATGVHTGGSR